MPTNLLSTRSDSQCRTTSTPSSPRPSTLVIEPPAPPPLRSPDPHGSLARDPGRPAYRQECRTPAASDWGCARSSPSQPVDLLVDGKSVWKSAVRSPHQPKLYLQFQANGLPSSRTTAWITRPRSMCPVATRATPVRSRVSRDREVGLAALFATRRLHPEDPRHGVRGKKIQLCRSFHFEMLPVVFLSP